MRTAAAILLDLLAVGLFAAVGRDTHERGMSLAGVLETAWPFAVGVTIGWLLARAWRDPWAPWPSGVVIWLAAVVAGLMLRWLTGDGVAISFQLVTLTTLGVLLVGPRTLVRLIQKRRTGHSPKARQPD